jgi:hypothetical protein
MSKGLVYLVKNSAFPHLFKVGLTTKSTVEERGLTNTSVPEDFETIKALQCDNIEEVEDKIHEMLDQYRHYTQTGRKTEFFYIRALELAEMLLQSFETKTNDMTSNVQIDLEIGEEKEDANLKIGKEYLNLMKLHNHEYDDDLQTWNKTIWSKRIAIIKRCKKDGWKMVVEGNEYKQPREVIELYTDGKTAEEYFGNIHHGTFSNPSPGLNYGRT